MTDIIRLGVRLRDLRRVVAAAALGLLVAAAVPEAAAEGTFAGRTVHVDYDSGDDARDGLSPRTARRTVPPPELIGPGTRILFKGGIRYGETIRIERGGTPDAPIVYDGNSRGEWGEGRAILDGSRRLGPWTPAGRTRGGLAVWSLPLERLDALGARREGGFPILFQDGRRGRLASSADVDDNWVQGQLDLFFRAERDLVTDRSITDPDNLRHFTGDWRGARVHLQYGNNHLRLVPVTGFDRETGTVYFERTDRLRAGDPHYAIANHPDVFAVPGEFLVRESKGDLLYIPFDAVDPNRVEVRAAAVENAIENRRSSHVVIRGFHVTLHRGRGVLTGSNRSLDRHRGVTIEDNEFLRGGGVMLVRADEAVVRGNRIEEMISGQPIFVRRSDRVRVEYNRVRRGGTGITAYGATNSLFKGNDTRETVGVHGNAMTIYEGSHNTRIIGNVIVSGRARMGLTLRESDGLAVAFNVIAGTRLAVAQWAQTPGGDRLEFYNNTFVGDVRIQPASAARSAFANNYIRAFAMQRGLEDIPLRVHNVYGRIGYATVRPDRFRTGEAHLPMERAFRREGGDPLDVRPTPEGREILGRGGRFQIDGVTVSHVGAMTPEGGLPDLSPIGLPAHDPDLRHR